MKEKHTTEIESKEILYEELEAFARAKIREHLQDLLEQEMTEWLGREKSERKAERFGTAGLSQWLRQDETVHDEHWNRRDPPAAGERSGGAVRVAGVAAV
jgi:hypothetical protein